MLSTLPHLGPLYLLDNGSVQLLVLIDLILPCWLLEPVVDSLHKHLILQPLPLLRAPLVYLLPELDI